MTEYPHQIIPPNTRIQLVDIKTGFLTTPGLQFLQQMWNFIVDTNQILPCTATHTLNDYILSTFPAPATAQITYDYVDYMLFSFVAPFTSTGTVTANVNSLGDLPVYKSNGASAAGSGDVVSGSLYLLIYNSNLNSGGGGFVIK